MTVKKILFATSEVFPVIKTGGLADVSGSLPAAIKTLRRDIKIIIPAYRDALRALSGQTLTPIASFNPSQFIPKKLDPEQLNPDTPAPATIKTNITILQTQLPGSTVPLWLVDSPEHFDRPGNPYLDEDGQDWPDNAERFALFCRVIEHIALGCDELNWAPDVVHCNDWQTGLVPALLSTHSPRPATIFTIHNLAYQGLFPGETFTELALPESLWTLHGLEFYGQLSFIKGGIAYADQINTVSPKYAEEICTTDFGYGLDPLLLSRQAQLSGILNGVDYANWSPAKDPLIPHNYNAYTFDKKALNKQSLQKHMGLPIDKNIPLFGFIGRLVEQKGVDLLLGALPTLLEHPVQFVILGSGHTLLEDGLKHAMTHHPSQISVQIGYDEKLAHLIEAGCDMFLMPSRYEPCGLNQIYSLRYGTPPIVRDTGGLSNTITDASGAAITANTATGFVFLDATANALADACLRAIACYKQPKIWKKVVFTGMQQDFSWRRSAHMYLDLYQLAEKKTKKSF